MKIVHSKKKNEQMVVDINPLKFAGTVPPRNGGGAMKHRCTNRQRTRQDRNRIALSESY